MPKGIYLHKRGIKHNRPAKPIFDRFIAKVQIQEDGCWKWMAFVDKAGYGRLHGPSEYAPVLYAHRVSFEHYKEPIPEGMELDHLCHNRWCVNPDHLEPVPHQVNAFRGDHPWMVIHRTGVCARGHELNEANTYFRKDRPGAWNCRICRAEKRKRKGIHEPDYRSG